MTRKLYSVFLATCVALSSLAYAESYQLTGKSLEMTWTNGGWVGSLSFPNVYCATAPSPEKAVHLTQAMYNGNAVYRAAIEYPEKLLLTVSFSSIPAGRSAEADVAKLLATNREAQERLKNTPAVLEVSELTTKFGATIGLRINNIKSDTPDTGPFPLMRKLVLPSNGALYSMSVHRIFARGSDRFEVAAMQLAPQQQSSGTEEEMRARLTSMVEAMTGSLQKCTGDMPLRVPK